MAGEIKVWSLGDHGVNASADPLHMDIGDVSEAQNATFYADGARGGLAKRKGMRILNSVALAGAVYAMLSVTLADPTPGQMLTDNDGLTLTDSAFMVLTE